MAEEGDAPSGEANALKIPISLTQQPISGVTGSDTLTTGSFFARAPQAEMQGAHNLLGGTIKAEGNTALLAGLGVLVLLLFVRKKRK